MSTKRKDPRKSSVTRIPAEKDPLLLENRALRHRVADLASQLKERGESRLMAPHEEEAIRGMKQSFDAMNEQQNQIAKFLRGHYADEINRGEHNGLDFAAVVIRYLQRERDAHKAKAKYSSGFISHFFGAKQ